MCSGPTLFLCCACIYFTWGQHVDTLVELWSPLQCLLVQIWLIVLGWCERMSLCANKQTWEWGWEKAHTNPGGCDVRRAGGVCGVRESSPHAGRPGLSGLDHMCLEGVRGSEKKKTLVKDFGAERQCLQNGKFDYIWRAKWRKHKTAL